MVDGDSVFRLIRVMIQCNRIWISQFVALTVLIPPVVRASDIHPTPDLHTAYQSHKKSGKPT